MEIYLIFAINKCVVLFEEKLEKKNTTNWKCY